MTTERWVTGIATLLFALLSLVIWRDYLNQTGKAYDDRDTAKTQLKDLAGQVLTEEQSDTPDQDTLDQLSGQESTAQLLLQDAERRINNIDGWNSTEWKLKNATRLAAPALAVLFAAFTLLSVLQPMRPDG